MTTKNTALSILLAVQLAVIAFVYWPGNEKTASKTAFFSDVSLEQIQGLKITDEEQTSISMVLNEGRWQIQQGEYPANREAIKAILGKIVDLQSARLVTKTKSSQVRLKVAPDAFSRKLELQLTDGTTKSFFLGTAPNNKTIHFRLDGENEVYQVKDLASWEVQTDNKSWWQTNYIDVSKDELQAVKINNPKGTLSIKKGAEDQWLLTETAGDQKVSQDGVHTLMGSITKLSLADYLTEEPVEDLGTPVCTIEYTTKSATLTVTIWPEDEENGIHTAKASNSNFYVTIRAYLLRDLLEAEPSLYITKPEAPAEIAVPEE